MSDLFTNRPGGHEATKLANKSRIDLNYCFYFVSGGLKRRIS